jgi:hypothetical protein
MHKKEGEEKEVVILDMGTTASAGPSPTGCCAGSFLPYRW